MRIVSVTPNHAGAWRSERSSDDRTHVEQADVGLSLNVGRHRSITTDDEDTGEIAHDCGGVVDPIADAGNGAGIADAISSRRAGRCVAHGTYVPRSRRCTEIAGVSWRRVGCPSSVG